MDRAVEIKIKLAKVADFLAKQKLDGVILSRRENFSWMTAGGVNNVPVNVENGVASLLVTPDNITMLTTNIEEPRIVVEELAGTGIKAVP
jgi:Xaa-Pro aminopeptidase